LSENDGGAVVGVDGAVGSSKVGVLWILAALGKERVPRLLSSRRQLKQSEPDKRLDSPICDGDVICTSGIAHQRPRVTPGMSMLPLSVWLLFFPMNHRQIVQKAVRGRGGMRCHGIGPSSVVVDVGRVGSQPWAAINPSRQARSSARAMAPAVSTERL
jgi:hypothetical protein